MAETRLEDLPNIGLKLAAALREVGVAAPADLSGRDPDDLFERLAALAPRFADPCVLDTMNAVVDYANGGPPRPWWEYSRERKGQSRRTGGVR
jgi:hypothetical protein